MSLDLKRLSIANARLEALTRTETNLHAQFLELNELRERLREAQLRRIYKRQRGFESPPQLLSQPPRVCCQPPAATLPGVIGASAWASPPRPAGRRKGRPVLARTGAYINGRGMVLETPRGRSGSTNKFGA